MNELCLTLNDQFVSLYFCEKFLFIILWRFWLNPGHKFLIISCGVLWLTEACCGWLWLVMVCCGVLWHVAAGYGVLWYVVACCGWL